MDTLTRIEEVILRHGTRGMDRMRAAVAPDYCSRAAAMALECRGRVLIGTGFPVSGSFETDGPIGAIALYRILEHFGSEPVFGCAPPISRVLAGRYRVVEVPILSWEDTIPVAKAVLADIQPRLIVSIERPGVAQDGRYYNMFRKDITDRVAKFDLFFQMGGCPTLAVGDGGNEIGMGNIHAELSRLPIIPSVTRCDELVIATVSNWGVYGIVAAMGCAAGRDLFDLFDPLEIVAYLVGRGAVDGKTGCAAHSEDGFPLEVGSAVIAELRRIVAQALSRRTGA
jgi:hypothetical protein